MSSQVVLFVLFCCVLLLQGGTKQVMLDRNSWLGGWRFKVGLRTS